MTLGLFSGSREAQSNYLLEIRASIGLLAPLIGTLGLLASAALRPEQGP